MSHVADQWPCSDSLSKLQQVVPEGSASSVGAAVGQLIRHRGSGLGQGGPCSDSSVADGKPAYAGEQPKPEKRRKHNVISARRHRDI
jgi:hypothetical protein